MSGRQSCRASASGRPPEPDLAASERARPERATSGLLVLRQLTSGRPPRADILDTVRKVRRGPKGDLSKREVHYVSQVVSKNCGPKCPGSAVQHHQQATYHH